MRRLLLLCSLSCREYMPRLKKVVVPSALHAVAFVELEGDLEIDPELGYVVAIHNSLELLDLDRANVPDRLRGYSGIINPGDDGRPIARRRIDWQPIVHLFRLVHGFGCIV
jgi:hypothetical protein